jgi:pentatricopeptide repeat protein
MSNLKAAEDRFRAGGYSEAADLLIQDHRREGLSGDALLFLGVALARARRNQEAIPALTEILAQDPNRHEALTWLAILTQKLDDGRGAIEYANRALALRPSDPAGYAALGSCHLYHRRAREAIEAFQKAASLAPGVAEHQHNLGQAFLLIHDHGKARECFANAIARAPRNPQSYIALAEDYMTYGGSRAVEVLVKGIQINPNSAALHALAGSALTGLMEIAGAEHHFRIALTLSPSTRHQYAAWLINQGRFEEALDLYRQMIRDNPVQGVAYYGILQAQKLQDASFYEQIASLRTNPKLGLFESMHLRYALGKAEDQRGDYEAAMADYDEANRLAYEIHNEASPLGIAQLYEDDQKVRRLYETLPDQSCGSNSQLPIFIVGMIRSGTTLLDQTVSSHPSVKSAGELRFWTQETLELAYRDQPPSCAEMKIIAERYLQGLEALHGGAERITDKMPLNFAYLGFVHQAMPNARFIHIRRHPVDTCLSIYTTYLGRGTPFAYKKANIVAYYREYLRVIAYWRERIPKDRLLEIDYEELVINPEAVMPKVIEFCGLPWNEACLHPEDNKGVIGTPSRWQARQPIYRSSVERWRNYQPWLGEFSQLLPI